MRRLLTLGMCGALMVGLAASGVAQKPGTGAVPPPVKDGGKQKDKRDGFGMKGMFQELNLTPAQQERIRGIMQKYNEQMRALKTSGLPKEQIMPKMKALKEAQHNEIRNVLTPAQRAKWDEMMKKNANRKKGDGRGGTKPPPPPGGKGGGI